MKQPKKPISIKAKQAKPINKPDLQDISESEDKLINAALGLIRRVEQGGLYIMSGGKYFEVSVSDAELVEAAVMALGDDRGCPTPIEQFIHSLLLDYSKGGLT